MCPDGSEILPDEAWVVRGGYMESSTLSTNARDYNVEFPGEWGISVASMPGWTTTEIAVKAPFRNRQMRVSTVGAVRALGHDVVRSGKAPHATLTLDTEPTEADWEALREVFGPVEENPRYIDKED